MFQIGDSLTETSRAAAVFAHPGHEWFDFGLMLRLQPDILFLSRGMFEDIPAFDSKLMSVLAAAGFHGTISFCDISEAEIFSSYLRHDFRWFLSLRDEVAQWIAALEPRTVICDAFEHYNSAHDLASLVTHSALRQQTDQRAQTHASYELALALHAVPNEEFESITTSESHDWLPYRLSDDELQKKQQLFSMTRLLTDQLPGVVPNDSPDVLTAGWTEERARTEQYRRVPADRNFGKSPSPIYWANYDQRGIQRVRDGRSREAITFADHFLPVVEALSDGSRFNAASAA